VAGALEFSHQGRNVRLAPIVQPLELARRVTRVGVGREQRQRDGRIEIADDRIGQTIGVDLPQLTASAGVAPDRPPVSGRASVICKKKSCPFSSMPRTSWICGSVWSMKFFGLPPPQMSTPERPPPRFAVNTIDAVSFTSRLGSIVHLFPSSASAATFMPIDESPGDDV